MLDLNGRTLVHKASMQDDVESLEALELKKNEILYNYLLSTFPMFIHIWYINLIYCNSMK